MPIKGLPKLINKKKKSFNAQKLSGIYKDLKKPITTAKTLKFTLIIIHNLSHSKKENSILKVHSLKY